MSFCSSKAGTEMPAPLGNGVINNGSFHSSSCISRMLPRIIYILHRCIVDSLLNYAPDLVVTWIEAAKNLEFHTGDHDLLDHFTYRL